MGCTDGAAQVEFRVADISDEVENGWRMASISDVHNSMESVKSVLEDKIWHICALVGGSVSGSGYNYDVNEVDSGLGHKLLVRGNINIEDNYT